MALVGEGLIESPILSSTLAAIPVPELQLEEIRSLPDERLRFLVWVGADVRQEFEAAVATDETIKSFRLLTGIADRRLYRLTLSETGEEASTYLAAAVADIVVLDLTVSTDGIRFVARLPSRDALRTYATACRDRGIDFQLKRLYEEKVPADSAGGQQFGLTDSQQRALRRALEMGYFDVPRETSVSEIADELETSTQALSTLLRRGERNLIENTVSERET